MLETGVKAPEFSLKDDKGDTITLSQFKGKKVVVYFYPKDNTPGCTKEACSFRDTHDRLLARGAAVIGISADSSESHARFKEKYNLPFFLLSDPEKNAEPRSSRTCRASRPAISGSCSRAASKET